MQDMRKRRERKRDQKHENAAREKERGKERGMRTRGIKKIRKNDEKEE